MKILNRFLTLSAVLVALGSSRQTATAQPDFGNFDPQQMMQQMQQRMISNIRDQLEVTNDADWNALEPLISKVTQGQMESRMGAMQGMMGGMGGGPGGPGGGGGGFPGFGQPDADLDALRKAIADKAPTAQIQALLNKYRDARQRKEDEMTKNQDKLKLVLTHRQEAVLVAMGVLK